MKNTQINIVREMGLVMQRASFSVVFSEGLDFSCALYKSNGDMLAQAENIPAHLGVQRFLVKNSIREIGLENIKPGDVILSNDAYYGGSHFPDVTVIAPIFYRDQLVAFAANLAHHSDMGGMVPGSFASTATETYQEALQLPPVRIMLEGKINRDVMQIIKRNVRIPNDVSADIMAQVASLRTGETRLLRLINKYTFSVFEQFTDELLAYSEARMRDGVNSIPKGEYEFEDYMDNDGISFRPYKIHVVVKISQGQTTCDFTGSDSQAEGPINASYSMTASAAVVAIKCIADPNGPANEGMFMPIAVVAPEGTIVNPIRPAPITGGLGETSNRIAGVVWGALSKAVPLRVIACQGSSDNNTFISGMDPNTNQLYILYDYPEGGWGARPFADGVNAFYSLHTGNVDNNLAEVYETKWPVLMRRYELRIGTGGAGKFRGGLGVIKEYTTWPPHKATVTTLADRCVYPPFGLFGGRPGGAGRWTKILADGKEEPLSPYGGKVAKAPLQPGEAFRIETQSGGGYGNPLERDIELVKRDVVEGYITVQQAKDDYGVVFGPDLIPNLQGTQQLRQVAAPSAR
jgi:N-methylhydantoinase B